jgi:hypothetical protein
LGCAVLTENRPNLRLGRYRVAAWSRCCRQDAASIQEQARSNRRETKI